MRKEFVTWKEVDQLIDHLIPQFFCEFDAILMICQGGVVPGGLLSESLGIRDLMVVNVEFSKAFELEKQRNDPRFLSWPAMTSFPVPSSICGRKILIVGSAWGTGRVITTVRNKVSGAGGKPFTCVLHYSPSRSLFPEERPDFFAASTDAWMVYPWEAARGDSLVMVDFNLRSS